MTAHGAAAAAAALVAIAQASELVVCSSCPFAACDGCDYQVACDGCGTHTADPWLCEHFALCPRCSEEGCRRCTLAGQNEARVGL